MLDSIVIDIAIPILGGIWALIQGSNWWRRRVSRKTKKALKIIRAAIGYVWKTYYRKEKKANKKAGTSVPVSTKEHAMKLAVSQAVKLGNMVGIDILSIFPIGIIQETIESQIKRRKW